MQFKIGVDGGGTKTECVLVDDAGSVVSIHVGAGSNPSITGPDKARSIVTAALTSLRAQATAQGADAAAPISTTLLCMAGSRAHWREYAASLAGFGRVMAEDDSLPVLELATNGRPGVVLHAGTGSFVAARAPDGSVHYAGGLGWRLGDAGSAHDIGRRAAARALLDLQGWAPSSRLAVLLTEQTGLADAASITRALHQDDAAVQKLAALAPAVLRLAGEGDPASQQIVVQSAGELLDLAVRVTEKLFSSSLLDRVPAGLSGPLLTHPLVHSVLANRTALRLAPVEGTPIEGVRRRLAGMK